MTKVASLLDVCRALSNNEFVYYYQPVISLVTGRIAGAEALIRWIRSDGSVSRPAEFIPLATQNGFITEMTRELFPSAAAGLAEINAVDPSLNSCLQSDWT